MERAEYERMHAVEDRMWWYRGLRALAAQLLARFVGKTPWAHIDIAGTALGSPQSDISKGWSSGWGVRLLDQLVRDHYES